MQNDLNEHIQNLMDRFFEGETSNAEEKELYLFFTQKDLPKQFEPYRKMFGFFDSGMADEATKTEVSEKKRKVVSFQKIAWTALAVAASLLLVFVIGSRIQKENNNFNPYEGSYMVKNGVRYALSEDAARSIERKAIKSEQVACNIENEALRQMQKAKDESMREANQSKNSKNDIKK